MKTKGLPHSQEAERALLGAIVLQPKKIFDAIAVGLMPEDFYFPKHQTAFQAMLDIQSQNLPIDPIQLSALFKARGVDGLTTEIVTMAENCYQVSNASNYARIIQDKANLRRFVETFRSLSEQALESESSEQLVQAAQSAFLEAMPKRLQHAEKTLQESMQEYMTRIETITPSNPELGFMTGFRDFDAVTKGFRKGQLIILAGRPGMGKSAFSTSIVLNRLKMPDVPSSIYIFSLEMTEDEIAERAFSGLARIDGDILKSGNLQPKHWNLLSSAHQLASKTSKVTICSAPNITTQEILAKCQQKLMKDRSLDLVIIDYLQLVTSRGSKRSEKSKEQEVAEISRDLKNLAKELKVPVIALSQLNRESESRDGHRPRMSDLRYSGSLEQDADIVCLIYRDEVYNPETVDTGLAEITVAKQRNGKTGMFKVAWNDRFTLFENYSPTSDEHSQSVVRPLVRTNERKCE